MLFFSSNYKISEKVNFKRQLKKIDRKTPKEKIRTNMNSDYLTIMYRIPQFRIARDSKKDRFCS